MTKIKSASKNVPIEPARMIETIYGCKWSLTIYALLRDGINRPGAMVKMVDGLTTKVLNQCLRKNMEFGILEKKIFAEIPPRVEYSITPFGEKFMKVLDEIEALKTDLNS